MRSACAFLVAFACCALARADAPVGTAPTRFKFTAPRGFTATSPDELKANAAAAPPELAERIRDTNYAFYAADLARRGTDFMENENVIVEAGSLSVTSDTLPDYERQVQDEAARVPGMSVRFVDASLRKIGGVTCGRFVQELTIQGHLVKQIGWLIPGHGEHALITFSTVPDRFDQYAPLFDQAAMATIGAEEPSVLGRLSRPSRFVIIGGLLGLIGGIAAMAARKKPKA